MSAREFDSRRNSLIARASQPVLFPSADFGPVAAGAVELEAGAPKLMVPSPPLPVSLVDRAMAFVQPTSSASGFAAGSLAAAPEFFPDPIVQRTSTGASSVHLHQQHRGLTIFQMARAVRFAPNTASIDAIGPVAAVPTGLDLEPKLDAAGALLAGAKFLASSGGETQTDRFGVSALEPVLEIGGFTPTTIAGFPLPSRPTVFEKGPFENPVPVYLLIFDHPDGPRLAWHMVITFPDYAEQFVVLVAADTPDGTVLYSKSTLHKALARGNVFEFSPGVAPRRLIDFPRPVSDYPAMPSTPLTGFPADWVEASAAIGNSTAATLNYSTTTLNGSNATPVLFDPASDTDDEQKLLNIFYFCNYMHDFLYLLGFDEAAGNFQQVNFTHTGIANDRVIARAHSAQVTGTANMSTGPDGQPPVMNMGLVSGVRHTAFDSDVVFHEYIHGLTNRLVGGLMQGHALDQPQSAGMGEGWSDFFALTIQNFHRAAQGQPEKVVTGDWVVAQPAGIRRAPFDDAYPFSFGDIGLTSDEHDVGEIWCAALMMMTRKIRAVLGSDADGYRLSWTLVVDGLKLTPANPNFLEARDAILLALDHLVTQKKLSPATGQAVRRAAWESFARFGMGVNAVSPSADVFGVVADTHLPAAV